ncbi:MAG: RNA 2',3'-cyclic phosphodiesterase [Caldilineaceae bacterium]
MRTFLAIELPEQLHPIIRRQQQHLAGRLAIGNSIIRWTPPANVHLTLRFLGETAKEQQRILPHFLDVATQGQPPIALALRNVGCFPNFRSPSIVWAGVTGDLDRLQALYAQVEKAVQSAGFVAEQRAFRPHLTIGRIQRHTERHQLQQVGRVIQAYQQENAQSPLYEAGSQFTVSEITWFSSELRPTGAIYTPIGGFPLAAP